ncbi:MAG: patatin-like protein [Candidatus Andeanibacterium colombiense]|uniref:Patatin-like protein n=1 Tax=Candidatus Andeanibacterium colombiense TaxID=3121345 RepID=A0AAJ5X7B0_9SPHN|nr:MAG: patatin-like protein [Sphingomonadaceae bacterium]
MRQKELRIALICYGGVSLAVYMHGVTKELWKLTRASRAIHAETDCAEGSETVYFELLQHLRERRELILRVLPDILTGASAGGINAVFLAQAIHSGQSLEPLTELWLDHADVDKLLDPEAHKLTRMAKFWAPSVVEFMFSRPGNAVNESVAPETREQVRKKLGSFVKSRWFAPPFSGIGFAGLIADALQAMSKAQLGAPLLPPGHPLDLFVTSTDFGGYIELLRLNSPPIVQESEHRLPLGFRSRTPLEPGKPLAHPLELVFAARSTASFPGAFPPMKVEEIDALAAQRKLAWPGRDAFLERIMPAHVRNKDVDKVSLIDGSVLVNAPFSEAMGALKGRPAQRETDRRFVYIDPRPDRRGRIRPDDDEEIGFFRAIFGSISAIPREQPIRDNLEILAAQSREAERLALIAAALRPEVERTVDRIFGRTFFIDHPSARRLANWRNKAQQEAAERAGYAFHSYAQTKFAGVIERLAEIVFHHAPGLLLHDASAIAERLREELEARGLGTLVEPLGGATPAAMQFYREHDIGFRIRRLRLLARRLSRDWEDDPDIADADRDAAREMIYKGLALCFAREGPATLGDEFKPLAEKVLDDPGAVLDVLAEMRGLIALDTEIDRMLAEALARMPKPLRRRILFAYLGFPFYDVATLPLLRNEGLTEFDPIKVDRISPHDATSIRSGGTLATLRGVEFYNFGAFFSRAYRENDYLWGRLHGAERMVDLVCSTVDGALADEEIARFKQRIFLAILDEEEPRLLADKTLVQGIRKEVLAMKLSG